MVRGYTRVRLAGCGAGAREVWSALLEAHDRTDGRARPVGTVRQVFDRSAYVEFDPSALGGHDRLGPPLVLLAGTAFDGPLATRLGTGAPGGFRPDGLAVGDACRLRRAAGPDADRRYVLAVGDVLDLEVDAGALVTEPRDVAPAADLAAMTSESAVYRRATAALEQLEADGVEDGLGWLDELARVPAGQPPTGDLAAFVDGWVSYLEASDPTPDALPTAVLGRGPGATPSGDDVTSGTLVALDRTASGARRRRVETAGRALVEAAGARTTTVSTALLAQAAQGRAAGRVDAALAALLDPDEPPGDWAARVRSATEVGHTSGVDLLVGGLLVPLAIGPALAYVD